VVLKRLALKRNRIPRAGAERGEGRMARHGDFGRDNVPALQAGGDYFLSLITGPPLAMLASAQHLRSSDQGKIW
jgi:hypothetical protein